MPRRSRPMTWTRRSFPVRRTRWSAWRWTASGTEGIAQGENIPSFELPDAEGQMVSFESLKGQKLLLVNWSPTCGFCRRIAPELAELQPRLREHDILPVFIATGEVEANRQLMEEAGLDP